MKEIKAFVGHSFTPADEGVVRKFTDYFDALSRSHPQFSWEHAESAEPRILTEKVLRIISDKNTFIGICTRKEQVTQPSNFLGLLLRPDHWKIRKDAVAWKTSDWIIQEIGLAIGKGLNVILLVEEGIRDPGGLQGDIEYIPFRRETPEQSFGKILQMLTALSPKTPSLLPAVSEDLSQKDPEPSDQESSKSKEPPDTTWDRETYEMAAFIAIRNDDNERLTDLSAAYRGSSVFSESSDVVAWDILVEFFRLRVGKGGKLERLRELVDRYPSSEASRYLGIVYSGFDQHEQSADAFLNAAKAAKSVEQKAVLISKGIKQLSKGKQLPRLQEQLSELRSLALQDVSAEGVLLTSLADLAEDQQDHKAQLALLERLIEIQPDNHEARFNLAYKHGEQSENGLAAYHYSLIPEAERSSTAWNNLGAALDQAKMPVRAVQAYTVASGMGDTLAMSNLGYKLMNAGFVTEAKAECEKATDFKEPHKNVGQLMTALQATPEQESEIAKELFEAAKRRVVFLQQIGAAAASEEPAELAATWQGPDCSLQLSRTGQSLRIAGTYERKNPFGSLGLLGMSPSAPEVKSRYSVAYVGTIKGRALFGEFHRARDGGAALFDPANTQQALMFFSVDGSEIFVMRDADSDSPTYERLRRIQLVT
ncbi:tetratricopeptide repeat protein [Tardiphaga alba]|uniref:Tetratricopeptide repeat protein n=1 Tax=Tardiphaga alba TaxID=340268 RepID=A0ABX8ABB3_9BRAD|nr:tetratricopeptide repeat protein [Tardiphaga alba]QUS40854.1 tetratricopeptide repeat protein [Tardiphaga alba]